MKQFRKSIIFLKKTFPTNLPVKVRRVHLKNELDGECVKYKDFFSIKVQKDLEEHQAIEVLLHEFAHVLSWDETKDFHSKKWGEEYARVYRSYLSKFLDG